MDEDILDEGLDNIIDIYWHESAFFSFHFISHNYHLPFVIMIKKILLILKY